MKPFSWFSKNKPKEKSYVYGLGHAILNIPVPPQSMWMNLGYWKDKSDLPSACSALLDQVLITANLLDSTGTSIPPHPHRRRHLLDVGIGCGDQSLHLLDLARRQAQPSKDPEKGNDNENGGGSGNELDPLFTSYTGLTILPTQADFARTRIQNHPRADAANIFCADAANPPSWSTELRQSLLIFPSSSPEVEVEVEDEYWVLGLDTLYHFHPSRRPLLNHAFSTLHASFMAFDLVLSDTASFWDKLALRIACWVSETPYANFLTKTEYEALLVQAGYAIEGIQMRDVSEHVFSGIARFLRRRQDELRPFGMGIGKFRGARAVFDWWARSGVVRGMIVVARA